MRLGKQAFTGRRPGLHPPEPSAAQRFGKHSLISQCLLFQVHFQKGQHPPFPLPAQPFTFLTELSCALSTLTRSGGHSPCLSMEEQTEAQKGYT